MSCAIIFICHNNDSINKIIHHNYYILFVGNQEISEEYKNNPKITVVRDLEKNIEEEKKLLTFTAWYAVCKNNLFPEYKYLCLLEYDVILSEDFEKNIMNTCNLDDIKVISFIEHKNLDLHWNINMDHLFTFLYSKNLSNSDFYNVQLWGSTSNQCVHRDILCDFVVWYYPSCLLLKSIDYKNLSWYHERIFMIYLKKQNINYVIIDGLKHLYLDSHIGGYNSNEALDV